MKRLAVLVAAVVAAAWANTASASAVALELALSVDVSGSVDTTEFNLQRTGYVNAFNDPTVQAAIANSTGGVAVGLFYFDDSSYVGVNWQLLQTAADASNFATLVGNANRPGSGLTGVAQAITFAKNSMASNTYDGLRKVIDVSGDGSENVGIFADVTNARNAALAAGITQINGLPILGSEANLDTWYASYVQGGAGSFTLPAASFADFDAAISRKIVAEITNTDPTVPLPASAWMGMSLLAGMGTVRMLRKRRA